MEAKLGNLILHLDYGFDGSATFDLPVEVIKGADPSRSPHPLDCLEDIFPPHLLKLIILYYRIPTFGNPIPSPKIRRRITNIYADERGFYCKTDDGCIRVYDYDGCLVDIKTCHSQARIEAVRGGMIILSRHARQFPWTIRTKLRLYPPRGPENEIVVLSGYKRIYSSSVILTIKVASRQWSAPHCLSYHNRFFIRFREPSVIKILGWNGDVLGSVDFTLEEMCYNMYVDSHYLYLWIGKLEEKQERLWIGSHQGELITEIPLPKNVYSLAIGGDCCYLLVNDSIVIYPFV